MGRTARPRRGKGQGTVYWDEKRQRYRGQAPNGRWVSGKTRTEAENNLTSIVEQLAAARVLGRAARPVMTVNGLLDAWVTRVVNAVEHPKTRSSYLLSVRHLRDQIGDVELDALTVDDVDRALEAMFRATVKSKSTLRRIRAHLRAALNFAVARDWVTRNVAVTAVLPAEAKAARRGVALTDEKFPGKLDALLGKLAGHPYHTLFTVQVEQGLRPGEVLGLTLPAVDVDNETLSIFRQMTYDSNHRAVGLRDVKTGNEGRGNRTLKMTPKVAELLGPLVEARQLEQQVYPEWPAEWRDLLFVTRNGTPHSPRSLRRVFKRAAVDAGLGDLQLRRYDLRHTACQRLLDDGVPIDQVADYLGHEDLRMVRSVYSHKNGRVLDPRPTRSAPS